MSILAIDPGKNKCGLAIVGDDGIACDLQAIAVEDFNSAILYLYEKFKPELIVLGDGTGSKNFLIKLKKIPKINSLKIEIIDEYNTTREARKLYWQLNPPTGWRKLLPKSFLVVPVAVDAYAALAIGQKWLEEN